MDTANFVRDSQTLVLPDGRTLGFAEYGSEDGYPVVFVHGFPTSRLEASGFDKPAHRRNIRVIAPDRPGYGLSTLKANGRIMDWPEDVKNLAQHLGITRFALLGGSGGGPYALACAHALPHDMLSAVGLLASSGPWEAGTHDLPLGARITCVAATYFPSGLTGLTNLLVGGLRYIQHTSIVTGTIDKLIAYGKAKAQSKPEDATLETVEEKRARVLRIALEGFAQGAGGFVHDAQLLSQPWGFELGDVTYNKVQIWHSTNDTNAPIWMARYMAEHLPHSTLTEFENDDHYSVARHLERVLSELLSGVNGKDEHTGGIEAPESGSATVIATDG